MKTFMNRGARVAVALAAAAALTASVSDASPARVGDAPGFKTIMSFLDNPRGLAQGPDGALYVTEAGHGGTGPCATMAGVQMCYGPTGAIARLKKYVVTRVATGLPSYAPAGGNGATGPTHICFASSGRAFVTYGLRASPSVRPMLSPGGADSGFLMSMSTTGALTRVADITGYEAANNPARDVVDSNPYGLACEATDELVTDAGANFLVRVTNGAISLVATFPATDGTTIDTVPEAVAVGPDHAYYVGGLSGKPFVVGAAKIYRVVPGQSAQPYLAGLTSVIDLAFARDGSLYVLEHASGPGLSGPGELLKISAGGDRTVVSDALDHPTALLIGRHGAVYVTNHGTTAGGGELLRLIGT